MKVPETKYVILPFIVLQMEGRLWLEGNIYRTNKSLFLIKNKEPYWRNIIRVINSYIYGSTRRFSLEIHFNGEIHHIRTSKKGHFTKVISYSMGKDPDPRDIKVYLNRKDRQVQLEVPEPFNHCHFNFKGNNRAVISDIDDTVLVTHTQNTFKKFRTLLVKNALKRKAVKEMKEFYDRFSDLGYPFIYVSNSEANLFPMIRLFLEHNRFPAGPIFLKPFINWNHVLKRKRRRKRELHKKEKIKFLLEHFPGMDFILIGDDSQRDPEIYADFASEYGNRIKEIYIRNVKKNISGKRTRLRNRIVREHNVKFVIFREPDQINDIISA